MANVFGVVVSGRPVITNFNAVSDDKFLVEIPDADDINHIVVFMTGAMPFPGGMGAAVHFCWPETGWSLLGFITNEKPSVIFKISGLKSGTAASNPFGAHPTHIAQIGISVERLNELIQQTPASNTIPSSTSSYTDFAQKMAENLFNYVASFTVTPSQMVATQNGSYVPLKAIEQWFTNTKVKLQANPNFWRN